MLFFRLSFFYFCFFSLLGLVMPYWSPYLKSLGMNESQIGVLVGVFHFSRLYAPSVWGHLADRSGRRLQIMRLGTLLGLVMILFLPGQSDFFRLALVMLLFSFFWNAVLPQFEVLLLQHLGKRSDQFGRIRLWGSIGFILAVLIGGELFVDRGIRALPYGFIVVMLLILIAAYLVPDLSDPPPATPSQTPVAIVAVLRQPRIAQLFALIFFAQLAHGPYNTFYTLLLQEQGYSGGAIGLLWSLGVVAEILLFGLLHKLWNRYSISAVLRVAMALSVLRWLLLAFWADALPAILVAQLLHAASFAVLYASGVRLVQALFPAGAEGRAQALHSSLGFGLGGVLGSIAAGYLWFHFDSQVTFAMAALASLIALYFACANHFDGKAQQNAQ